MSNEYEFLSLHSKLLKLAHLWPKDEDVEKSERNKWTNIWSYFIIWANLPTSISVAWDIICLLVDNNETATELIQPVLAFACLMGSHYLGICFLANRKLVRNISLNLGNMSKFRPLNEIIETDRKGLFYTKLLLIYSTLGIITYVSMPLLPSSLHDCVRRQSISSIEYKIPCELVCRARIPMSYLMDDQTARFVYLALYIHQIFLVSTVTWIIIILTMLLCSIVLQLVHHFRELRKTILKFGQNDNEKQLKWCIIYHIEIIRMCQEVNDAFGSQMTMFLTLPSFVMSILGFELLIVELTDFIRFGMHLIGWICLLLLVCYSGQTLIDESGAIALDAYYINWHNLSVPQQKDVCMIIMRAQKPQMLNALNFGYLSFATFLKVISSAYSYFTLLINLK